MRLDGSNKSEQVEVEGVSAPKPDCEANAPEAPAHDHEQALLDRPRVFTSSHFAEAALRARLMGPLDNDALETSAAPDVSQSAPGAAPDITQAGPTADANDPDVEPASNATPPTPAPGTHRPEAALDGPRNGTSLIRRGASGPEVEALQQALNAAGIEPQLEVDGQLGADDEAAIRGFQRQHGCQVDGIVGPETLGAIDQARGIEPNPAAAAATQRYRAGAASRYQPTTGTSGAGEASGAGGVNAVAGQPGATGLDGFDRIIEHTLRFESGGRYDAWNADDNGHGVSFGLIQFNQQVGSMPRLLREMNARDPQRFRDTFGPHANNMLNADWVRGANLNSPDIRRRLQASGRDPVFQGVQRDLAREAYLDPAIAMGAEHGITSERGIAMLFDSAVQNGRGGTRSRLRQAARGGGSEREILDRFAGLADRGRTNGRRRRLFNSESLSDSPPRSGTAAPAAPGASDAGASAPASGTPAGDTPARVSGPTATGGTGALPGGPIGPNDRVLMIGDSHSVGTFGNEMDRQLRATGAQVESYGSSGSSASWWMNGTTTRSGFVARHTDGTVERPNWRTPHETPRLQDLIRQHRPTVLVVSLGGNMRGLSPAGIRRQVQDLARLAQESGTRLVWAGPPERRVDNDDGGASLNRFNNILRDAVAPYGGFIDSSRHTEYSGGDGLHYSGRRGRQVATDWAENVMHDIQGDR
jgi:peptidoglycan hydrolase-like protein with peptidoglycan-binding domain